MSNKNLLAEKIIPLSIFAIIAAVLLWSIFDPSTALGHQVQQNSLGNLIISAVLLTFCVWFFIQGFLREKFTFSQRHNFNIIIHIIILAAGLILSLLALVGWSYDFNNPHL